MFALYKMNIVIIIPAWDRIDHFIAFINQCPVQGINKWPSTGCDQNFICIVIKAFSFFNKF